MPRLLSPADLEAAATGYITPNEECHGTEFPFTTARDGSRPGLADRRLGGTICYHGPPPGESLARMLSNAHKRKPGSVITLKDRVCCYQWTWFTMVSLPEVMQHVLTRSRADQNKTMVSPIIRIGFRGISNS